MYKWSKKELIDTGLSWDEFSILYPERSHRAWETKRYVLNQTAPIIRTTLVPGFSPEDEESYLESLINIAEKARNKQLEERKVQLRIETDQPIAVAFTGDWHIGQIGVAYKELRNHNDILANTPGVYVVGMGDYIQNAKARSKPGSSLYQAAFPDPDDQKRFALHELKKLKGRWLALISGCFIAGTPVTMSDGTTKPIEKVCVGERVLTHIGNVATVTETSARLYSGTLSNIKVRGTQDTIWATPDHLFWTRPPVMCNYVGKQITECRPRLHNECHRQIVSSRKCSYEAPSTSWKEVSTLQNRDYVFTPTPCATTKWDLDKARLLGYYVSEGHIIWYKGNPRRVSFTFGFGEEEFVNEVVLLSKKLYGTETRVHYRESRHTISVDVSSRDMAYDMLEHGGNKALYKRLSESAFGMQNEAAIQMIGAMINGDGGQVPVDKHGSQRGVVTITTISKSLANQIYLMLPRFGILGYLHRQVRPGKNDNWLISIGVNYINDLVPISDIKESSFTKQQCVRIFDNGIWSPVYESSNLFANCTVYNIEVDHPDHSYLVHNVGVHNCHLQWDYEYAGIRTLQDLNVDLGAVNMGPGGVINLAVGKIDYTLLVRHRYRGDSGKHDQLGGFHKLYEEYPDESIPDVVALAHYHFNQLAQLNKKNREVTFIRSGSYYIDDDYANLLGGYVGEIGVPIVILSPSTRQVLSFSGPNFNNAIQTLNDMRRNYD